MRTHDGSEHIRADDHERALPVSSADRAEFWAGLNRYVEAGSRSTEPWLLTPARVLRRTTHDDE